MTAFRGKKRGADGIVIDRGHLERRNVSHQENETDELTYGTVPISAQLSGRPIATPIDVHESVFTIMGDIR